MFLVQRCPDREREVPPWITILILHAQDGNSDPQLKKNKTQ